jgi:hypothetical protein
MTRTKLNVAAVAAAIIVLLAASMAVAGGDLEPSTVSLKRDGNALKGKVRSDKRKCVRNRKVHLYQRYTRPQPRAYSEVDSTRAGNKGKFRFAIPEPNNYYYATIDDTRKCLGYASFIVHVGPG